MTKIIEVKPGFWRPWPALPLGDLNAEQLSRAFAWWQLWWIVGETMYRCGGPWHELYARGARIFMIHDEIVIDVSGVVR